MAACEPSVVSYRHLVGERGTAQLVVMISTVCNIKAIKSPRLSLISNRFYCESTSELLYSMKPKTLHFSMFSQRFLYRTCVIKIACCGICPHILGPLRYFLCWSEKALNLFSNFTKNPPNMSVIFTLCTPAPV